MRLERLSFNNGLSIIMEPNKMRRGTGVKGTLLEKIHYSQYVDTLAQNYILTEGYGGGFCSSEW